MRKILLLSILLIFSSCEKKQPQDINIKFSYGEEGAKNTLKNVFDSETELINTKKTEKGLEITVDKIVGVGIKYYGKARVSRDTIFLDYWCNVNEDEIPSAALPLRFKYEIIEVKHRAVKFNFLGNKFKVKK